MIHWMLAWFFGLIVAVFMSVIVTAIFGLSGAVAMFSGLCIGITVPLLFIRLFGDL